MVVSYASKIYTKDRLFFLKLLFRWTGSVWEMLWVDYIFFVTAYVILAVIYHQALANHEHRMITFEAVVRWLSKIRTSVPLSFMLGFFVSTVFSRWWSTCMAIPWLSSMSFYTQALVESTHPVKSDIARKIRITILRYSNLSWILMMATISQQIKDRFGFNQPLKAKKSSQDRSAGTTAAATAGTGNDSTDGNKNSKKPEFELTWRERLDLINLDEKVRKHFGRLVTAEEVETFARSAELSQSTDLTYSPEYWLPLAWATRLIKRSRMLGLIAEERELLFLVEMINKFRGDLGTVWSYTEFNVPLVYTQVAVAAVYLFLFSTLLSTQLIRPEMVRQVTMAPAAESINETQSSVIDTVLGVELLAYFPILGSLEFIFYLGWFKIGIMLLNPLGKDRADLPLSDILNSNLKASVKLGGAEDSLFPPGLTDNGEPVEQQVSLLLRAFDFSEVHAHDNFTSAEEVEAHLHKHLLRRLQGTGKEIVNTLDFLQLRNVGKKKSTAKAAATAAAASAAAPKKSASGSDLLDKSGSVGGSGAAAAAAAAALAASPSTDSLTSMEVAAMRASGLSATVRNPRRESMPLLGHQGGGDDDFELGGKSAEERV
ncbi:hypothetical protein BOX15_Mlig017879g1 [Macrostomum lignano]|uniref:Bestrophin homolog n=1 Tax=Macrostomum lignano TaxID=282301 RepID=A0A267EEP4_9PLAT|nr:hypothetical protein BOX15_Mlig017879g1 [Macrostomum lignano]